jgi:hypothetical protein
MPVIDLIRQPLNVALTVAEGALDATLAVVRAVRGLVEEDQADTRWSVADPPAPGDAKPAAAPPPPPPARPRRARPRPAPAAPAPEPMAPLGADHVSEEPVQVAEFAEAGAEDGASAELNVAEPWEGYASQDARAVVSELAGASREKLAAVELYEATHKKRRSVSDAAARRLKALSGPAASRTR